MNRKMEDRRSNTVLADNIQHALFLVKKAGLRPALDSMRVAGVPRALALRVLSSPEFQRTAERRHAGPPDQVVCLIRHILPIQAVPANDPGR